MTHSEPIVHIGYHKTGTTWFQSRVYPNVRNYDYVDPDATKRALLAPNALAFDVGCARRLLTPESGRPPLICDENLSGDWRTAGMRGAMSKEVAQRLAQVFGQPQIVIFIRNQVDTLAAVYAQYLKSGGSHRPERLFFPERYKNSASETAFKRPLFQFEHFRYLPLIRLYRSLFGEANVHVYTYEAFREAPHTFLEGYSSDLDIDAPLDTINYGASNTAFRSRTLKLARLLNHFTSHRVADKCEVLALLPRRGVRAWLYRFNATAMAGERLSPEALLGPELTSYIRDFYADSNPALAAELRIELGGYGYPGVDA